MLIRDIIAKIRNNLGDQKEVGYCKDSILERVRMELNTVPAEAFSDTEIINKVRIILEDPAERSGEDITLESIRAALNDTAKEELFSMENVITNARIILEDPAERSGEEVTLESIRAALNDEFLDNNTSINIEQIADSIRVKMGIVSDADAGMTDSASVDPDSVLHYAQFGIGSVSGSDGAINNSLQLAVAKGDLQAFVQDGLKTIAGMRPDATLSGGILIGGFQEALNLYVLARCMAGEVESSSNPGGYTTLWDRFTVAVKAVGPHIRDSVIQEKILAGEKEILARRPDLGMSNKMISLLENYVFWSLKGETSTNLQFFYNQLNEIPYHYTDDELNQYITDAKNAVLTLRADAEEIIDCFGEAIKSYVIYHAMGTRYGKAAENMTLYQFHHGNFNAVVQAIPHHWTQEELSTFVAMGQKEIVAKRPDLAMTNYENQAVCHYIVFAALEHIIGNDPNANSVYQSHIERYNLLLNETPYHYNDTDLTQYIADAKNAVLTLRADAEEIFNCFGEAIKSYVIYHAMGKRYGKAAESMTLYQFHHGNFNAVVQAIPHHWTQEELSAFVELAKKEIFSKRPDLAETNHESLLACDYTVFTAAEHIAGKDSRAETLYKTHSDRFYTALNSIPKHYSDEELNTLISEGISVIRGTRSDMVYTENAIREDLLPALIFYAKSRVENNTNQTLSDKAWGQFTSLLQSIPYHWENSVLLGLIHDSIRDILSRRADARMDEYGYERQIQTVTPSMDDNFDFRDVFAKISEYYCTANALAMRNGKDNGADVKYMLFTGKYQELIQGAK